VRFDTRLVQAGQRSRSATGGVIPPIHLATTYERSPSYFYGRGENPTWEALEACLAALEDVRFATVCASGQAAAATVLSLLGPSHRVVASDDLYAGTYALFAMLGVKVEYAKLANLAVAERALSPSAGAVTMVWIETPSNPLLQITDVEAVCGFAHKRGALVVVDNTLASPALQQPLRWADVSLYSTTKSIAGHLDALGGALVYDDEALHERFTAYRRVAGNVPGALESYLVRRGLKTLSLRVARQVESAEAVVEALQSSPAVGRVLYPGLAGHSGHDVAARQMSAAGSIVSFQYRGDVAQLMADVRVFAPAVSLGGVQSLIECPALMTHAGLPAELRRQRGIVDNLVRLSIGIEDPADLIADLTDAMQPAEEAHHVRDGRVPAAH
jgi:cystathionine gamma-lyase